MKFFAGCIVGCMVGVAVSATSPVSAENLSIWHYVVQYIIPGFDAAEESRSRHTKRLSKKLDRLIYLTESKTGSCHFLPPNDSSFLDSSFLTALEWEKFVKKFREESEEDFNKRFGKRLNIR